jgi:hypothetical protein
MNICPGTSRLTARRLHFRARQSRRTTRCSQSFEFALALHAGLLALVAQSL